MGIFWGSYYIFKNETLKRLKQIDDCNMTMDDLNNMLTWLPL